MSKNNNNLIWLDMEMSGLNPETDMVLEIALVITDPYLTIIGEGPVIVIHQSDEVLSRMDSWNQSTHGKSGLIEKVKNRCKIIAIEDLNLHKLILNTVKYYKTLKKLVNRICPDSINYESSNYS